uniref:Dienelactone hydrolase domain-containing protein n=1 Tax=Chlamydomonas leiostraca TaxID=1034604 RepID=A0A6T8RII8_9CHLO|mmetsp:Transcript_22585/g.57392  ORF Transcript_22585/g.57392 Transcript_22585/m.57392 type:complete len:235 (+) Transcript_22585:96-800(+)|eukprot:CAMPEP_0202860396 /NCGR_PEP_ID=MMETSP1391-20130828/2114_1 /ASSEMBLY_ACC=CAM_ASM_000867 /TAXON_ID=1034604 /ORGANISM="Chlamydomonas leiostraca, Strain SAG 11-49" /LENGTH=234 /DNA_ID=CAMNT_0049539553 /DNA_START=90 /DNA_END=794 /DNA_ORIENTATION=+
MPLTKITFGDNLPGYEGGDKNAPAIIVIQEWWGVNEVVKSIAAKIAEQGFRVLVPDLYKGKIGLDAEEASHLMNNLDFQNAVKEIGAAAKYLKDTGSAKVGVTGFCMGGALSFASAIHVSDLSAAAPCYGIPPAQYFQIENIKIPVLGTFGGKDAHAGFSDPESALAAEKKIKDAGGNIDMKIFPNAPHSFFNQLVEPEGVEMVKKFQNGVLAPEAELKEAFDRLIAFFKKQLQ